MFTTDERMEMVQREVTNLGLSNVEIVGFNALLMKFAKAQSATVIVRGLRAVADFEYEYQMAGMNQQIDPDIETVFVMADVSLQPIASKLVKEIALFGGEIAPFVSPAVRDDVVARVEKLGRLGDY
jgi:pantetheine-phosphate adenylyltransferase